MKHVPSFVENAEVMKSKGIDLIACISVNDCFVMDAWGKSLGADALLMLADGNARFALGMGVELDLMNKNMGIRSRRYAMLIDDCTVKPLKFLSVTSCIMVFTFNAQFGRSMKVAAK
jgi:peroxiredoxin